MSEIGILSYIVTFWPGTLAFLAVIGTIVLVASIIVPLVVKLTPTQKDDAFLAKLQQNPIVGGVIRTFSRFSLITKEDITKKLGEVTSNDKTKE